MLNQKTSKKSPITFGQDTLSEKSTSSELIVKLGDIIQAGMEKGNGKIRLEVSKEHANLWVQENHAGETLLEVISVKTAQSLARVLFNVVCTEKDVFYAPAKAAFGSFEAYYGEQAIQVHCTSTPMESVFGECFEITIARC